MDQQFQLLTRRKDKDSTQSPQSSSSFSSPSSAPLLSSTPAKDSENKDGKIPSVAQLNLKLIELKKAEFKADLDLLKTCEEFLTFAEAYYEYPDHKLSSGLNDLIHNGPLSFELSINYLQRKLNKAAEEGLITKPDFSNALRKLAKLKTDFSNLGNHSKRGRFVNTDPNASIASLSNKLRKHEEVYAGLHKDYGGLAVQYESNLQKEGLSPGEQIDCLEKMLQITGESPHMEVGVAWGGNNTTPKFNAYCGFLRSAMGKLWEISKDLNPVQPKREISDKKGQLEQLENKLTSGVTRILGISFSNGAPKKKEIRDQVKNAITNHITLDKETKSGLLELLAEIIAAQDNPNSDVDIDRSLYNVETTLKILRKQQDADRLAYVKNRIELRKRILELKKQLHDVTSKGAITEKAVVEKVKNSMETFKDLERILAQDKSFDVSDFQSRLRNIGNDIADLQKRPANKSEEAPLPSEAKDAKEDALDLSQLLLSKEDQNFLKYLNKAEELVSSQYAESTAKAELEDLLFREQQPDVGEIKNQQRAPHSIEEMEALAEKSKLKIAINTARKKEKVAVAKRELREIEEAGFLSLLEPQSSVPSISVPQSSDEIKNDIKEKDPKQQAEEKYRQAKADSDKVEKEGRELIWNIDEALKNARQSQNAIWASKKDWGNKARRKIMGNKIKSLREPQRLGESPTELKEKKQQILNVQGTPRISVSNENVVKSPNLYNSVLVAQLLDLEEPLRESLQAKAKENIQAQGEYLQTIHQELSNQSEPIVVGLEPSLSANLSLGPSASFNQILISNQSEAQRSLQISQLSLNRRKALQNAREKQRGLKEIEEVFGKVEADASKIPLHDKIVENQRQVLTDARKVLADSSDRVKLEKFLARHTIGVIFRIIEQQATWMQAADQCQLDGEQAKQFADMQANINKLLDVITYLRWNFLQDKSENGQIEIVDPEDNKRKKIEVAQIEQFTQVIKDSRQGANSLGANTEIMTQAQQKSTQLGKYLSGLCTGPMTDLIYAYEADYNKTRSTHTATNKPSYLNLAYINDRELGKFSEQNDLGIYALARFLWGYAKSLTASPSTESTMIADPDDFQPVIDGFLQTSQKQDEEKKEDKKEEKKYEEDLRDESQSLFIGPSPIDTLSAPIPNNDSRLLIPGKDVKEEKYRGPLDDKQARMLAQAIRQAKKSMPSLVQKEANWENSFQKFELKTYLGRVPNNQAKPLDTLLQRECEKAYDVASTVLEVKGIGKVRVFPGREDGNLPHKNGKPYIPRAEYWGLGISVARGFLEAIKHNATPEKQHKMMGQLKVFIDLFQQDLSGCKTPKEMEQAVDDLSDLFVNELVEHKVCKDADQGGEILLSMRYFVHEKTFGTQAACYETPLANQSGSGTDSGMIYEFDSPIEVGIPVDESAGITDPWDKPEKRAWFKAQEARLGKTFYRNFVNANKDILPRLPNKSMENFTPGPRNTRDVTLVAVDHHDYPVIRQNYIHTAFPQPLGVKDPEERKKITRSNFAAVVIGRNGERLKNALQIALKSRVEKNRTGENKEVSADKGKIRVPFLHASFVLGGGDAKKGLNIQDKAEATDAVRQWIQNHPPYLLPDGNIHFYDKTTGPQQRKGTEIEVLVAEDNSVINWSRIIYKKTDKDIQHIMSILDHTADTLESLGQSISAEQDKDLLKDWKTVVDFLRPARKESKDEDVKQEEKAKLYDPELRGGNIPIATQEQDEQGTHTDKSWAMKNVIKRMVDFQDTNSPFAKIHYRHRYGLVHTIQAAMELRAIRGNVKLLQDPGGGYDPSIEEHEAVMLQILTRAGTGLEVIPPTSMCASSCDRAEEINRHVAMQMNYAMGSKTLPVLLRGGSDSMQLAWDRRRISRYPVGVKRLANRWRTDSSATKDDELRAKATFPFYKDVLELRREGVMSGFASMGEYKVADKHQSTRKGKINFDMTLERYQEKIEQRKSNNPEQIMQELNDFMGLMPKSSASKPRKVLKKTKEKKKETKEKKLEIKIHANNPADFEQNVSYAFRLLQGAVTGINKLNDDYTKDIDEKNDDSQNLNPVIYLEKAKKDELDIHSSGALVALWNFQILLSNRQYLEIKNGFEAILNFLSYNVLVHAQDETEVSLAKLKYFQTLQAQLQNCFKARDGFKQCATAVASSSKFHTKSAIMNLLEERFGLLEAAIQETIDKLNKTLLERGELAAPEVKISPAPRDVISSSRDPNKKMLSDCAKVLCEIVEAQPEISQNKDVKEKLAQLRAFQDEKGQKDSLPAVARELIETVQGNLPQGIPPEGNEFTQTLGVYDQMFSGEGFFAPSSPLVVSDSDDEEEKKTIPRRKSFRDGKTPELKLRSNAVTQPKSLNSISITPYSSSNMSSQRTGLPPHPNDTSDDERVYLLQRPEVRKDAGVQTALTQFNQVQKEQKELAKQLAQDGIYVEEPGALEPKKEIKSNLLSRVFSTKTKTELKEPFLSGNSSGYESFGDNKIEHRKKRYKELEVKLEEKRKKVDNAIQNASDADGKSQPLRNNQDQRGNYGGRGDYNDTDSDDERDIKQEPPPSPPPLPANRDGDLRLNEDEDYHPPLPILPAPSLRSWSNWSRRDKNRLYNIVSFMLIAGVGSVLGVVASGASLLSYYLSYAIPPAAIYMALLACVAVITAAVVQNALRFTRKNWDHVCLDIPDVVEELRLQYEDPNHNPDPVLMREFVLSSLKALYDEDSRRNTDEYTVADRARHLDILNRALTTLNTNQRLSAAQITQLRQWLQFLVGDWRFLKPHEGFTDRHPRLKTVIIGIATPVSWGLVIVSGFFAVDQFGIANKFLAHYAHGTDDVDKILKIAQSTNLWIILGTAAAVTVALALQRWSATRVGQYRYTNYASFLETVNSEEENLIPDQHANQNRQDHVEDLRNGLDEQIDPLPGGMGQDLAGRARSLTRRPADLPQPWLGLRKWAVNLISDMFIIFSPRDFLKLPPRRQLKHLLNFLFTGLTVGLLLSGNAYLGSTFLGADLLGGALAVFLLTQLLQEFYAARQSYLESMRNVGNNVDLNGGDSNPLELSRNMESLRDTELSRRLEQSVSQQDSQVRGPLTNQGSYQGLHQPTELDVDQMDGLVILNERDEHGNGFPNDVSFRLDPSQQDRTGEGKREQKKKPSRIQTQTQTQTELLSSSLPKIFSTSTSPTSVLLPAVSPTDSLEPYSPISLTLSNDEEEKQT